MTRAGVLSFDENCKLNKEQTLTNLKAFLISDHSSVVSPTTARILELEYALEMSLSFLSHAWGKEKERHN